MKTGIRLVLASALLGASAAHSALVNFSLDGSVDFADAGNVFGLTAGDTIFASGTFDDSAILGTGASSVTFGSGSGNSLTLSVGSLTFFETDDTDYASGGKPELTFFDAGLDGLNFATTFGAFGFFDSLLDFFDGEDDSGLLVSGTWDLNSYSTSPVPIPGAIWLLGSGMVGLFGMARRKRT